MAYAVSLKDAPVDQESRFKVKMNCEMSVFWLGLIARLGHIVTTFVNILPPTNVAYQNNAKSRQEFINHKSHQR